MAERSAANKILAETLFNEGQKLMDSGRFSEGCPKLAESQRLDPAAGTLLNLAVCHEKEGKTATAWTEFKEAASLARRDARADRVNFAEEHAAALEPQMSRVIIAVAPDVAKEGLEVRFDEAIVGPAAWGVAMPANPGTHRIRVNARGKKGWETTLDVPPRSAPLTVSVATRRRRASSVSGLGEADEAGGELRYLRPRRKNRSTCGRGGRDRWRPGARHHLSEQGELRPVGCRPHSFSACAVG